MPRKSLPPPTYQEIVNAYRQTFTVKEAASILGITKGRLDYLVENPDFKVAREEGRALAILDNQHTSHLVCKGACGLEKSVSEFPKFRHAKTWNMPSLLCNDCMREATLKSRASTKDNNTDRAIPPVTEKYCSGCDTVKSWADFGISRVSTDMLKSSCKICCKESSRKSFEERLLKDPKFERAKSMVNGARNRSKSVGLPFDLDIVYVLALCKDICPYLQTPINYFARGRTDDSSPSLDRILPHLGYTKGNVIVVTWRGNRIKNDATLEEINMLAEGIQRITWGTTLVEMMG